MKNRTVRFLSGVCIAVLLSALMAGCDGGIFGTGDGSSSDGLINSGITAGDDLLDAEVPESPTAPETSLGASDSIPPADTSDINGVDTGDSSAVFEPNLFGFNAATDTAVSFGTTIGFINEVVVSSDPTAGIELINLTETPTSLFTSADNDALPIASTAPAMIQANGEVPSDTTRVFIDAITGTGDRVSLTLIEPTSLAPGSKSLFFLRRTQPTVDVIVLPSNTADPDQLQGNVGVRLVTAALIGDPEVPSVFTLVSDNAETVEQSIIFEPLTDSAPVSNFQPVPSGFVTLSDDVGRYTDLTITLPEPGSLVTVVLDPALPGQHLVISH